MDRVEFVRKFVFAAFPSLYSSLSGGEFGVIVTSSLLHKLISDPSHTADQTCWLQAQCTLHCTWECTVASDKIGTQGTKGSRDVMPKPTNPENDKRRDCAGGWRLAGRVSQVLTGTLGSQLEICAKYGEGSK